MSRPSRGCARCGGAGWIWLTVTCADQRVRSVEASCPACCGPAQSEIERWRQAHRWTAATAPCGCCGEPTHLHDRNGLPAHALCAARPSPSLLAGHR